MGPYKPQFSLGLDSATSSGKDYYRSLPFKRSWIAILISGAFLAMFSTPLFTVGGSLLDAGDGGLFSLVSLLFTGFWLLGWSTGVAVLLILFLILVFGRETLRVNQGDLILRVGLFGIGFGARYRKELVRDFRSQQPDESAGTGWRGPHLVFNYGREEIGFGSAIDEERAQFLITELRELFPSESSPPAKLDFSAMQEKIRMPGPPMVGIETGNAIGITSLSSLALLVANLIPILGVLLYDWDIGEVMLLFWAESAVIGFYNLLKLGKVSGWAVLFYGPFFVGHYGGFMAGHLLF
ncbi:MAG: hypothetical protein HOD07_06320, partial [Gammaproteobacteria bacterium]|nr:hypothetical protein [Gammaproteobacteria bacterium]